MFDSLLNSGRAFKDLFSDGVERNHHFENRYTVKRLHGNAKCRNAEECRNAGDVLLSDNDSSFEEILHMNDDHPIRLINNPNLTKSLQSLSHRCLVADLSNFYRYFHGHCSQEIKNSILDPVRRVRTTRSSTHSHSFKVTLPNPRTLAHKSYFIPRTSQLWNSLPPITFPESYKLSSFKSNINKLDLLSLST